MNSIPGEILKVNKTWTLFQRVLQINEGAKIDTHKMYVSVYRHVWECM